MCMRVCLYAFVCVCVCVCPRTIELAARAVKLIFASDLSSTGPGHKALDKLHPHQLAYVMI